MRPWTTNQTLLTHFEEKVVLVEMLADPNGDVLFRRQSEVEGLYHTGVN